MREFYRSNNGSWDDAYIIYEVPEPPYYPDKESRDYVIDHICEIHKKQWDDTEYVKIHTVFPRTRNKDELTLKDVLLIWQQDINMTVAELLTRGSK